MSKLFFRIGSPARPLALVGLAMFGLVAVSLPAQIVVLQPAPSITNHLESILRHSPHLKTNDLVVLNSGDILYGALNFIQPEHAVRWTHPDVLDPIDFHATAVREVYFRRREPRPPGASNLCRIRLVNGDELSGELLALTDAEARLQTWYAGAFSIPRDRIQFVFPLPPPPRTLFSGPSGLDGWIAGEVTTANAEAGQWSFQNGSFYATKAASIGRDLHLPDTASLSFDLAWRGTLNLAVALYTGYFQPVRLAEKENEPSFGGFYSLQLNNYSANVLPVKQHEPLRYLGQASTTILPQKSSVRLELRISKPKRSIALLLDGQLLKQWVDTEDFAGTGTGIKIVHQGQGSTRISNITVAEWDGQFYEPPSPTPQLKTDFARLKNDDSFAGSLLKIENGIVHFLVGDRTLNVPVERVMRVEFPHRESAPAPFTPATARAHFHNSGVVTFQIDQWTSDQVVASSPNFGTLTLDPAAFKRVELNLHLPRGPSPPAAR